MKVKVPDHITFFFFFYVKQLGLKHLYNIFSFD